MEAHPMAKVTHLVLHVADVQKSREWYVDKLGFKFESDRGGAVRLTDQGGLTIFLMQALGSLAGQKITLTIQVDSVDRKHEELAKLGVEFINPPKLLFWGYGAEVLDPDGYKNDLWDEVTMAEATRQLRAKKE
jgi:catechol 2,3-dioxygenase-like lactoylglutathione lyase family enzyme